MFGGHNAPQQTYATTRQELAQFKSAPILNPHFNMVVRYLDCLNRFMDALIAVHGPGGVREWLLEVTAFLTACQKRTFQRMPL
ncbi:hypothetical protein M231_02627 [Tremella mesenterica]|uniref:Uncharacterized protein n=2 Tax=Tremella mesenterica TaxID=5217 RepID=A0A4Q1BQG7_TREME|nr:hypothetical protein M231_02627 [Tremella mesenterica]